MQPKEEEFFEASGDAKGRVVVVDDSVVQLRILERVLRKEGYHVFAFENPAEALRMCQKTKVDFVISDWMMPEMTGLELCRRFRSIAGGRYGYFILLTSKSSKSEVATGLDAGADDFLSKPVNISELQARMSAGARILEMERELQAKNKIITETLSELQALYDTVDQDLQQARKIQEALIPERKLHFDGGTVSFLMQPCGHVGGDVVGAFQPTRDKICFYNLDISGHGICSALVSARMASHFDPAFPDQNIAIFTDANRQRRVHDPAYVAQSLNSRLVRDTGISEYLTMVFAVFDTCTGELRFVQAGHPPPILLRKTGELSFLGDGGLPIGLLPDGRFQPVTVRLNPGDRCLLYSDGFSEAIMNDQEMLQEQGLADLIRQTPNNLNGSEFLDDLLKNLRLKQLDATDQDDDISAVLFEFDGPYPRNCDKK